MAITVATVKLDFYDRYPQAENTSDARFLRLLERVDTMVAARFNIRNKTFETEVVAGQREYPLAGISGASDIVQIFAAEWWPSSDQNMVEQLKPVDRSYLDQYMQGWKTNQNAVAPERFGLIPNETDRALLLVDPPDTTSAGTPTAYPRVKFHASTRKTYSGGDSLPAAVMNAELYLALLCFLYSQVHDRKAMGGWLADANYWARDFENQLYGTLPYDRPNLSPALPTWPTQ